MYYYDMHVHSREGSLCGLSAVTDMVRAFDRAGYSGFVLTDHFVHGNTAVPRNWPWKRRMQAYYDIYETAKEAAKPLDFTVLFGLEHAYQKGKEILTYGIDLPFLLENEDLEQIDAETYVHRVHQAGGLCFQAHPYREASYIPPGVEPRLDLVDGLEIFNAVNPPEANQKAEEALKKFPNLLVSSGSDAHSVRHRIGYSGLGFPDRIRTNQELVNALKKGLGTPVKGNQLMIV